MIRWIIQVRLPWRAVLAKSVRRNPLFDRGVGVLESIVWSAMNRRRGMPARQRFRQNFALAVGYGPVAAMRCNPHPSLERYQSDTCFQVPGNRIASDGYAALLRMKKHLGQCCPDGRRNLSTPYSSPDHKDRLSRELLSRNFIFHRFFPTPFSYADMVEPYTRPDFVHQVCVRHGAGSYESTLSVGARA